MRIITGIRKGASLVYPNDESVRPTTDRVKENIFNLLGCDFSGKVILDLFAGSGGMGLEAVSRGAQRCIFVDNFGKSAEAINKNIKKLGFFDKSTFIKDDAVSYLERCSEKFDVVFLDPPYHKGLINKALYMLKARALLRDGGLVITESDYDENIDTGGYEILKSAKYGRAAVKILKSEPPER